MDGVVKTCTRKSQITILCFVYNLEIKRAGEQKRGEKERGKGEDRKEEKQVKRRSCCLYTTSEKKTQTLTGKGEPAACKLNNLL